MQELELDLTEQLCIIRSCRGAPRMQGQDLSREGLPKRGPQNVAPRLASPTTMVGHNSWSIMRGSGGRERGSRKSLNFGREKLDSMRGAQGAWFGKPICATTFINYNL